MTNEEFVERFRKASEPYTDREIADRLGVSVSTPPRWRKGKNLPHRLVREHAIKALED